MHWECALLCYCIAGMRFSSNIFEICSIQSDEIRNVAANIRNDWQ